MKEWVSIKEAALLVGKHQSRIYKWIDAKSIEQRIAANGTIEIRAEEVLSVEATVRRGRPKRHAAL